MVPSTVTRALTLLLCGAPAGCGDVVVGQYSGTTADDSTADATAIASAESGDGSSGGAVPICTTDDFADGFLDPARWNVWTESDSSVEERDGRLRFTPPSEGLFDAGIVGHFDTFFAFDDGSVRMRIADPPAVDQPVALFLIVASEPETLALSLGGGSIEVAASVDEVPLASDSFPMQPYPAWVGIRAEGSVAHFEISDDGVSWTRLTTLDIPGSFEQSAALVMAQTYGTATAQQEVSVLEVEVCDPP